MKESLSFTVLAEFEGFLEHSSNNSLAIGACTAILAIVFFSSFFDSRKVKAPIVHAYSTWEPAWLTKLLFVPNGFKYIANGYEEV